MALFEYRNCKKIFGITLTGCSILLTLPAPAAHADSSIVTITFDDIPLLNGESSSLSNGYQGLDWNNFEAYNPAGTASSGYLNSIVSGSNIATDFNGGPASISSTSVFTINSFELTGAWNDGLTVAVTGLDGTNVRFVQAFTVNTNRPTLETLNWAGLTQVNFASFGGTNPGYSGHGVQFALDNVTVTTSTPEPSPMAAFLLGGLGMLSLGFKARRRSSLEQELSSASPNLSQ